MIAEEPMPTPATALPSQLCTREQMLREALGSTDIWAWEYQLDQKRLELSTSTWRLFASKDNVFHQFLSFIRPEDRFMVCHSILRAVSLRRGFMIECLTLSHNALPELKIQIQANLTQTADGLCLRGIVQNMSSLRTSAKATHDDRFRSLFQLSAVGLVYGDIEGNIVDVNEKFASLTGYDRSSIIGSSIFRFAHPADHTMTLAEQRKLLSKPNTQAFLEKRYIHKDGHTFWVQVCVSTFAGSNGKNKYFVALVQDIDERVKAQDTVKQIEENFRILAESIPQIVWVQDNNGYVIYLNQQWTDYTGRSIEDSLGLKWLNVMHPDDRKTIIANIDLNDAKDEDDDPPWREAVQRFRMADGSYRWFLARAVPVRNEQGDNIRWLGTSTDIDTHKKIEKELDEARMLAISASESKGAFLANMSHEIRTPLGIILGYCELLKRPGITPELQNDFLLAMTRNGHELSQLIDNILDLSKMEAEKLDLALMKFDVESQIKGIIDDLRMKAQEKNLSISLNFADSVPKTIIIDELRLRQILINIVGNAIKFTDQGQIKVELQMLSTDRLLAIDVTDTGDGIDSHQIERLFKAFSQVDATSTRRHGGTGLGLMLSRMLANLLGGDVILLHSTLGQGSCFRITINPYFELETLPKGPIEVSPRKEFEPRKVLVGLQILLAEDAPDNQFIFSSFLRDEGADVDIAENGKQAVLKGLSKIYDLILMDIQMPIMDGYDATRHLRAGGYKGPIIALSAHALTEDSDKSKLAGCDDHITKPVDFDRLVKVIEQFTSRT